MGVFETVGERKKPPGLRDFEAAHGPLRRWVEEREARGMSQDEIARELGRDRSTLWRWLRAAGMGRRRRHWEE